MSGCDIWDSVCAIGRFKKYNVVIIFMSSSKKGVTGILQAIWSGDTWWAFFVHIGLALLLIRFVLYPLLGVIFATGFPIVAVVSGSMEHAYVPFSSLPAPEGQMIYQYCDKVNLRSSPFFIRKEFTDFSVFWQNCGDWYEQKNITAERFSKFAFLHGFNTGDIMILYGTKSDRIEVGDVNSRMTLALIDFPTQRSHRVSELGSQKQFVTSTIHFLHGIGGG